MILKAVKILILTLLRALMGQPTTISTELWISSVLDEAAMKQNGAEPKIHSAQSALHCLGISQSLEDGQASCFARDRPGEQCTTWGTDALASVTARWNGTVGTTSCKIRKSFYRCYFSDGSSVGPNEKYAGACDEAFICTENGSKPVDALTSCSEPFVDTPAGCLYIEDSQMSWCSGRQTCKILGGDLYTADSAEKFSALREYLMDSGTDHEHLWVAVKKLDGVWQWLPSGRSPGPDSSGDWTPDDPNGEGDGHECARAIKSFSFKIGDNNCDNWYNTICQVVLD